MTRAETILAYHAATRHHFRRYARSTGAMDWANQPNPFRIYEGVERVALPLPNRDPNLAYAGLYAAERPASLPLSTATLGSFLALSMGLSAWKQAGGDRWPLRIPPSSGNLHPSECHLILPPRDALPGGVYHYGPYYHALFRRAEVSPEAWRPLAAHLGGDGFLVALSTIFWREAWKYGERAYRYCNLDTGHGVAALALAARLNGWQWRCISGAGDDQISTLLGFDRTAWHPLEAEVPDLIGWVDLAADGQTDAQALPQELVQPFAALPIQGRPNRLSRQVLDWAIIPEADAAARKPATPALACRLPADAVLYPPPPAPRAAAVIRQRRSAQAYDPDESIDAEAFLSILDRTRPRSGVPPFDAQIRTPAVDLLLFVHRVRGLAPGLYFLSRSGHGPETLRALCRPAFIWETVRPGFPLWLLQAGDCTHEAMTLSCHQEIAGDGAFALAMLAPLAALVREQPFLYRHLHWECGLIGQVLYLEAEAHGLRGTGIGCYFDEPVNQLLGIDPEHLQSLYHFTIGHPLEDRRLQTLPAYHHLRR
ncbi:MAG: nitroreductase family protein [Desulfatitalea sp.]|nr:nitroreductase family protein [Desulfatitalea sp.]